MWDILPRIPLVFWSNPSLIEIGNNVENFKGMEPSWETKVDRRWAWAQVEINLRDGLVENIKLVCGEFSWSQKVDYWRLPFTCFVCHKVGHI